MARKKTNTKPILVVVDMQATFDAANDLRTINAVAREIAKAKQARQWIIFLEYDGDGDTHPCLTNFVNGYANYTYESKTIDDGSGVVQSVCEDLDLKPESFVVCGVNIQACVLSTVRGLTDAFPTTPIRVVKDACNGYPGCRSFKNFDKLRNVVVD